VFPFIAEVMDDGAGCFASHMDFYVVLWRGRACPARVSGGLSVNPFFVNSSPDPQILTKVFPPASAVFPTSKPVMFPCASR
jgi:hypothetical protein